MTGFAKGAMPLPLVVAKLLGLGTPELILVLVVILVLFSGRIRTGVRGEAERRGSDPGLTRYERQILIAVGVVFAAGIIFLLWLGAAR